MKLSHLSIKWKLMGICVLLVTIPVVILGELSYKSSEKEIYVSVEQKLKEQVGMIHNRIKTEVTIAQQNVNSNLKIAHYMFLSFRKIFIDTDIS